MANIIRSQRTNISKSFPLHTYEWQRVKELYDGETEEDHLNQIIKDTITSSRASHQQRPLDSTYREGCMDTNTPHLPGLHYPNPNRQTQTDRHSVKITHNVNVMRTEPKSLGLVQIKKGQPDTARTPLPTAYITDITVHCHPGVAVAASIGSQRRSVAAVIPASQSASKLQPSTATYVYPQVYLCTHVCVHTHAQTHTHMHRGTEN